MKLLKTIIKKILICIKSIYWKLKIKEIPDGLCLPKITIKNTSVEFNFEKFGAPNEKENKIWQDQTCGIAALKMLTDATEKTKNKTIYQMAQESRKYNTFIIPEIVNKPSDIIGIFHEGLLQYAKSFGFAGFRGSFVPLEKVIWYLYKDWFFLASVNIYRIWDDPKTETSGKHIVLIVGFKTENGKITEIYYKDSSTRLKWNNDTDIVTFDKFNRGFNQMGIFLRL